MDDHASLKQTPLAALHRALGARMVPFAGYEMPVQYPAGVLKEHLHTRAAAGLFDVSHMGQIRILPASGKVEDAAAALETLVPADILGLGVGRQRYALFTNAAGGILDDLMVVNRGDHLFLVVNAANKHADFAHLQAALSESCSVEMLEDRALIALQGPRAEAVLAELWADVTAMRFMDVAEAALHDIDCLISRSGYTGEDGFEISVPAASAEDLARRLLEHPDVLPIGLGARDSLRLEAGLCLHGNDIDPTTNPVEAALTWAIGKARKPAGARAGGFPGADVVFAALEAGPKRLRVGLAPEGKAPVRAGVTLFASEDGQEPVGSVSSGGFGPSAERPVAMGYVDSAHAKPGTALFAELRGKRLPVAVAALPFVAPTFKR
ncbi:glycine cleavage system protein T [Rhizobium rhizosphaerae]|uniref:aminomethyltransferase n=1 Tax=Xaviernesmea rhizosphaerae TaxID=1672749 RepID=A0A1Q9ANA4_9HYPH|nr:glycine cleavage system aminomethyltransferase GcvT [Xaviernesmea rhizosphaerae]OLP56888.1 glycine cleavage system protein T [Xaviernesmea rhizosphaerae]